jgi:hypothetical protein
LALNAGNGDTRRAVSGGLNLIGGALLSQELPTSTGYEPIIFRDLPISDASAETGYGTAQEGAAASRLAAQGSRPDTPISSADVDGEMLNARTFAFDAVDRQGYSLPSLKSNASYQDQPSGGEVVKNGNALDSATQPTGHIVLSTRV